MAGFMGLRGLEVKAPREMSHNRGDTERVERKHSDTVRIEQAKRSHGIVDKIIREQGGGQSVSGETADDGVLDAAIERKIALTPIGEVMSAKVAVLTFDDTIMTAMEIFSHIRFRHLPIVDESGGIIGVISDRDVLRNSSPFYGTINEQNRDREIMGKKVGLIMTRKPLCVNPETPMLEAIRLMNGKRISCLPVVAGDSCRLLGIATWKDVVHALCPVGFKSPHDSGLLRAVAPLRPAE